MKKAIYMLLLLLAMLGSNAASAKAQFAYAQNGPPSGNCYPATLGIDKLTGNLYSCGPLGSWQTLGGITNNQLLSNPGTSTTFISHGASEDMIVHGGSPEVAASLLGIPTANQKITATGSASIADLFSCGTPGAGSCTQDGTLPLTWPLGVTSNTKSKLGFGFNDLSNMGGSPTAAALDWYHGENLAWEMMLGIPDYQKLTAQSNCTATGTWTVISASTWPAGTLRSTTAGSTLTCTGQMATYAGVIIYKSTGSSSTFNLSITNAGVTTAVTDPVTGSATITQTEPYATAWGGTQGMYAIGQSGLNGGTTTITYTCVAAGNDACVVMAPFFLNAGSSIGSEPAVVKQLAPRQNANGTCSNCLSGHSDAQINIIRQQDINAVNLLRANGLNITYVDPNATPNGANPNLASDTGQVDTITITAGGTGYLSGAITFSGCTIEPTIAEIPVVSGVLTTGAYTVATPGECTTAPTLTFTGGGTGAAGTATLDIDEVHPNTNGAIKIATLVATAFNAAQLSADKYIPPVPAVAVVGAAGPFTGSTTVTGNTNLVVAKFTGTGAAAATYSVSCHINYPDPGSTGRAASGSFTFNGYLLGQGIFTSTGHWEYTSADKTFGTPTVMYTTSPYDLQIIIPIQNYVSGTETVTASCVSDGGNYTVTVLPGIAATGTAGSITVTGW